MHLRSQHCAEGDFGLTHLYNVMDDGGYRDLAACHLRLDRAVTACYGWSVKFAQDRGELVARLARLNAEIVAGRPYAPFPKREESESARRRADVLRPLSTASDLRREQTGTMTERKAVTRAELADDEVAAMLAEALTGCRLSPG